MITSSEFFNKTLFDPEDGKIEINKKQYQFIDKINISTRKNKANKNRNQNGNQKSKKDQRSNKNRYSELSGIKKDDTLTSQNNNKSFTQRLSPLQFSLNQLKNTLGQVQQNQSTKFHPQNRRYLSTLQPHHQLLNSSLNSVSPWVQQINHSHYNKQRQKIKNLIEHYKFQKSLEKNKQTKNYLKTKGNLINSLEFKRTNGDGSDQNDYNYSKEKELPSIYDRNKRRNQIKSLDINKSYEDYLNGNHLSIRQIGGDCKNYNFSTSRSQRRIKETERNKDKKICNICMLQKQSKNNIHPSNINIDTQPNIQYQKITTNNIPSNKSSNSSHKCHHTDHDLKITQDLKCKNYLRLSSIQINQISKHVQAQINSKHSKKPIIFNKQLYKNRNLKKITLLPPSSRKLLKQQFVHNNLHNKNSSNNKSYNQNPDNKPIKLKFQISGSKTRKLQYQNMIQLETKKDILDNNQYSYYQSIVRSVRSQLDYNDTQKTSQS